VYDAYGNRAMLTGAYPVYMPGNSMTPQVAANNASAMVGRFPNNRTDLCGTNNGQAQGYDAAGNWVGCASLSVSNMFDAENRLITATGATFVYDGGGQRVAKTNSAGTTWYVYDAKGDLAAEYSNEAPVATGTQYLTADHLGSTRMVDDGGTISYHDYLPFGEEIASGIGGRSSAYDAADGVNQKFTGKERDAETGLDYFGARYLSSAQGRWMSPDWSSAPEPIPYGDLSDPQTLNLYGYVRNNPLGRADLDGHCTTVEECALHFIGSAWSGLRVAAATTVTETASVAAGVAGAVAAVFLATPALGDPHEHQIMQAVNDRGNQQQRQVQTADDSEPQPSPEPQVATNGAGARSGGRKPSSQIRKEWEAANDQKWPADATTGKNHDVSHETALADGGTNTLENIKPRPHPEHVDIHKQRGDFKRWGSRSQKPKDKP
jgi:RHS repeat-associated protein